MLMLFTIAALFFAPMLGFAETTTICPVSPLSGQNLDIASLRKFVGIWNIKGAKIEDFSCCLPNLAREHVSIAHSSVAAQNARPDSPRAISMNFAGSNSHKDLHGDLVTELKLPNAIFTINGGHAGLLQTNNVEVALIDPSGKIDFYDIDIRNGKARLSAANPGVCMSCHGKLGVDSKDGNRLIFNGPNSWPNFVGGTVEMSVSAKEKEYLELRQEKAAQSTQTNPRFRCLKAGDAVELQLFDTTIGHLNALRVAKLARASKDYEKYKYAIMGGIVCPNRSDFDCQFMENPPTNCRPWFSPEAAREMKSGFTRINTLNPEVISATSVDQLEREKVQELVEFGALQDETLNGLIGSGRALYPEFAFHARPALYFEDHKNLKGPTNRLTTGEFKSDLFKRFAIDTNLRNVGGQFTDVIPRILFETRGVPIHQWSTAMGGGYVRPIFDPMALLELEPPNSSLMAVMEPLGYLYGLGAAQLNRIQTNRKMKPRPEPFERYKAALAAACDGLRRFSLEATSSAAQGSSSKPTTK